MLLGFRLVHHAPPRSATQQPVEIGKLKGMLSVRNATNIDLDLRIELNGSTITLTIG